MKRYFASENGTSKIYTILYYTLTLLELPISNNPYLYERLKVFVFGISHIFASIIDYYCVCL